MPNLRKKRKTADHAASAKALLAGLDRLPVAFALFDAARRLAAWNAPLAALGLFPKSLLKPGVPLAELQRRDAGLKRRATSPHEVTLPTGRVLQATRRRAPPGHLLITYEDVTDARLAAQRYDLAMRGINEGVYDWDVVKGSIYFSERVQASIGMTPKVNRTPQDWRRRIHPGDLPEFDRRLVEHFKGRSERFECDYRFRALDGSWRWARQHGIAIRDARGRAVRMVGSTGDITALKRVEQALQESQERYTLATRAATEGIYEWNLETDSVFLSDRAKDFWAVKGDAFTPATWNQRIHGEDFEGYRKAIRAHIKGRKPVFEHEYRIRNRAGGWSWVADRAVAVRDGAGRVTRLVGAVTDITERKLREEDLRRARDEAARLVDETQRLLKDAEQRNAELAVINSIQQGMAGSLDFRGIIELVGEKLRAVFGSDNLSVVWWDEQSGTGHRLYGVQHGERVPPADHRPDPNGAFMRAMYANRPVLANSRAEMDALGLRTPQGLAPSQATLTVPIFASDKLLGGIALDSHDPARRFSEDDQRLLQTVAATMGIALETARLFNETREALERQTATAEILKVISSSPTDLAPVYRTILESITRLCASQIGALFLFDGERLSTAASHGTTPEFAEILRRGRPKPSTETTTRLAALERRTVHVADLLSDATFSPTPRDLYERENVRTVLSVPMLRDTTLIGVITTWRREVRPFDERQIGLIRTFADQAVIAIENVRLFKETQEALAQQAASAEVLQTISESVSDSRPVFTTILNCCERLIPDIDYVQVQLVDEQGQVQLVDQRFGEVRGATPEQQPARRAELMAREQAHFPRPLSGTALEIALRDGHVVVNGDTLDSPDTPPATREDARRWGHSYSQITVPLVWESRGVGAIEAFRRELGGFLPKECALLETFADQAVIAIQNARLFNETKEALERQTATAEVLQVISKSVADAEPVFEKIVQSCQRLFDAGAVGINLVRPDGMIDLAAYAGPREAEYRTLYPARMDERTGTGQAIRDNRALHFPDALAGDDVPPTVRRGAELAGMRTVVLAPLLWEERAIGAIFVARNTVSPFSEHEIPLLKTFADQAAIAIQNARMFNETEEALERQTATANVLKAISRSTFDLGAVLETLISTAARLCRASLGVIFKIEGDVCRPAGLFGATPALIEHLAAHPPLLSDRVSLTSRAVTTRHAVQVEDALTDKPEQRPRVGAEGCIYRLVEQ